MQEALQSQKGLQLLHLQLQLLLSKLQDVLPGRGLQHPPAWQFRVGLREEALLKPTSPHRRQCTKNFI